MYLVGTLSAFPFIGSLLPACYVSYGGVAKFFCHLTPTRCLHPFRKKHTPHLSSYKPSRRKRELSDNRTRAGKKSVRILSFTFLQQQPREIWLPSSFFSISFFIFSIIITYTTTITKIKADYPPPTHFSTAPTATGLSHFRGFTITLRHTTLDRTPLKECWAWCRNLCLKTHNTHNTQTSVPPAVFDPTIPASWRPQTHNINRADSRLGSDSLPLFIFLLSPSPPSWQLWYFRHLPNHRNDLFSN